jgi:hypothetical protein
VIVSALRAGAHAIARPTIPIASFAIARRGRGRVPYIFYSPETSAVFPTPHRR